MRIRESNTIAAATHRILQRDALASILIASSVFFTQALLVRTYAVPVLFSDEWELVELFFRKHLTGTVSPGDFFALHNEHRIVTTRLLSLATFIALGNIFSPIANMLVSALVNGILAGIWIWTTVRLVGWHWLTILSCLLLVSPVQYENMFWGFQIQFYTLMLGCIGGACGLALIGRLTWGAVLTALLGMWLATFSMASGVVACVTLPLGLLLLAWCEAGGVGAVLRDRRALLKIGASVAGSALTLTLFFWEYRISAVSPGGQARDWGLVWSYLWMELAYPAVTQTEAAWHAKALGTALVWGPILGACALLVGRRSDQRLLTLLIVVAASVAGMSFIIAFGRFDGPFISSRYTTVVLWSSPAALLALVAVIRSISRMQNVVLRRTALVASNVAAIALLLMHLAQVETALVEAEGFQAWKRAMNTNIVGFLHDNEATLADPLPYPSRARERLVKWLTDPTVQSLLPPELVAQRLEPAVVEGDAWTPSGEYPFYRDAERAPPVRWGSWSGNEAHTGVWHSAPFEVRARYLVIPVIGYPHRDGNRLIIEPVDRSGRVIVYTDANPGEQWGRWIVDMRGMEGQKVRLAAVDGATDWGGWFGFGAPYAQNTQVKLLQDVLNMLPLIAAGALLCGAAVTGAMVRATGKQEE